jgi:hypothetical protein
MKRKAAAVEPTVSIQATVSVEINHFEKERNASGIADSVDRSFQFADD